MARRSRSGQRPIPASSVIAAAVVTRGGIGRFHKITPGAKVSTHVHVVDCLSTGEAVITSPGGDVRDGMRVRDRK